VTAATKKVPALTVLGGCAMGGVHAGGMGDAEEGRLVAAPAASLRPSAERNPLIREKPRMNGAPGAESRSRYKALRLAAF